MKTLLFIIGIKMAFAAPSKTEGWLVECSSMNAALEWRLSYSKKPDNPLVTLTGSFDNPHGPFIKHHLQFPMLNSEPADYFSFKESKTPASPVYVFHPNVDSKPLMQSLLALVGRSMRDDYTCENSKP